MKTFVLLGSSLHLVLLPLLLFGVFPCGTADAVSYDGRSLIINGNRRILFSGSIHYPRSTPQMWPGLIAKAKEGGIDVIQTYVFWNVHEAVQGQFDFQGRKNLVGFIKEIQRQGLYVSLRIGPYIEGEWKYGGIPYWLHDVPGIVFRSDNEPFKQHMQNFVSTIVNMMEVESLYAPQGGPIILSQIENEYGNVEPAFHEKGPPYVRWAASMAVGLNTGVPWMMCKQDDAPGPVINACNGMDCGETFVGPNSPNKPAIWTENWTSFFQTYGTEPYVRSAQDIAYSVALFIAAKKGSFVNYYMYHGGTNFGRTAASYMITSYYDQAPLDEYGLIQQPKWGHLKELHSVIKACSETILFGAYSKLSRGKQEAHVFQETSGRCVAFIANRDPLNSANVQFRNNNYMLPRRSISILPDCKNVLYSTAKVSVQQSTRSANIVQRIQLGWQAYADVIPKVVGASFSENALLDQMTTTKDETDYLWYSISYKTTPGSNQHVLRVDSKAHIIHAFVNNVYLGNTHGDHKTGEINFEKPISLRDGDNDISLLSVMVGSPDSGAFLERRATGIHSVSIRNSGGSGALDISRNKWGYQTGLVGEKRKIYLATGLNNVVWGAIGNSISRPLMWYKTTFNAPTGNNPVALDLSSMGKGEVWINGESIGRYWVSFKTPKGQPSQSLYHIPSSFMKPSFNLLVLFEEMGGNPLGISLATISTRSAPVANVWNSWNSTREPLRTKYIYG